MPHSLGEEKDEEDEDEPVQSHVQPPEVAPVRVVRDGSRDDGPDH